MRGRVVGASEYFFEILFLLGGIFGFTPGIIAPEATCTMLCAVFTMKIQGTCRSWCAAALLPSTKQRSVRTGQIQSVSF